MEKTIIICGLHINSSNRGINAIANSVVRLISIKHPDSTLYLFANNNHKYERLKLDESYKKIYFFGGKLRNRYKAYLVSFIPKWFNYNLTKNHVVSIFRKADIVLDFSAGDGFSDIYGISLLLNYQLGLLIASNLNIPVIKFPQTIGPFHSVIGNLFARFVLGKVNLIMIRDTSSLKIIEKFNYGYKTININDIAYILPAEEINEYNKFFEKKDTVNIGINISGLLFNKIKSKGFFKREFNYEEFIKKLIIEILRIIPNAKLFIIPHDYNYSNPGGDDDLIASKNLLKKIDKDYLSRIVLIDKNLTATEVKGIISKMEFLVGSRMHACIAALSQSIPTAAIAYSYKFKGIMENIEMEKFTLDPNILSDERILEEILSFISDRRSIKNQLLLTIPNVKNSILNCVKYL